MVEQAPEKGEDYVMLERYIEGLQTGYAAHLPQTLPPDQARIYALAALFHSIFLEISEPRPEFVTTLHARLERFLFF